MNTSWPSHHQDGTQPLLHDSSFPALLNFEKLFFSVCQRYFIKPIHYVSYFYHFQRTMLSSSMPNNSEMHKEQIFSSPPVPQPLVLPSPHLCLCLSLQSSNLDTTRRNSCISCLAEVPGPCLKLGPYWAQPLPSHPSAGGPLPVPHPPLHPALVPPLPTQ